MAFSGLSLFQRFEPALAVAHTDGVFVVRFNGAIIGRVPSSDALDAAAQVLELVAQHSRRIAARTPNELSEIFIGGMRNALDRYTSVLVPDELRERESALRLTDSRSTDQPASTAHAVRRDGRTAVLTIASFATTTASDVRAALTPLVADGVDSVIIDVRGNGGGLVDSAAATAELFLARGVIVDQRARLPLYAEHWTAKAGDPFESLRIAIVTDGATASAAEAFTAALVDSGRAVHTGRPTYGKGTAQVIETLPNGYGLVFSVAELLGPTGARIEGRIPSVCADACRSEPSNDSADLDRAAAALSALPD